MNTMYKAKLKHLAFSKEDLEGFYGDDFEYNPEQYLTGWYVDGFLVGTIEEASDEYVSLEWWSPVDRANLEPYFEPILKLKTGGVRHYEKLLRNTSALVFTNKLDEFAYYYLKSVRNFTQDDMRRTCLEEAYSRACYQAARVGHGYPLTICPYEGRAEPLDNDYTALVNLNKPAILEALYLAYKEIQEEEAL